MQVCWRITMSSVPFSSSARQLQAQELYKALIALAKVDDPWLLLAAATAAAVVACRGASSKPPHLSSSTP
jgi:hypothetical protein